MPERADVITDPAAIRSLLQELFTEWGIASHIDHANTGNVAMAQHLLRFTMLYLATIDDDWSLPLRSWLYGVLKVMEAQPEAKVSQVIAPRPRGGRRPKYADDFQKTVFFGRVKQAALMALDMELSSGTKMDSACTLAAERVSRIIARHGMTCSASQVRDWYYDAKNDSRN
jgi:hypothetical protein